MPKAHEVSPETKPLTWPLLLEKGIRAPSADNLQPWQFVMNQGGRCCDLWLDAGKINQFCDTGMIAPYISAGAVIENIRIAAAEQGQHLLCEYFPDAREPRFVARLSMTSQEKTGHPHAQALERRSTNRKFYSLRKALRAEDLLHLQDLAAEDERFSLRFLERSQKGRYARLAGLIGRADRMRFEIKRLHREFFEILRLSKQDADCAMDGLDLRTLELGPSGPAVFSLMQSWERLRKMNRFGMSRLAGLQSWLQMMTSQAAGLLTVETAGRRDYVEGGEVMQRVWHEMTLMNIAMQPMEGLPIFFIGLDRPQKDMSRAQQDRLVRYRDEFRKLFDLNPDHGIILLFRMGYAPPAKVASQRRPLKSFLTSSPA